MEVIRLQLMEAWGKWIKPRQIGTARGKSVNVG